MNVGIIGLGKMGLPIAANLLENGFTVIGYRRHMSAAEDFITMGGLPASSCQEVAARSDIVLTCLPGDSDLLEVVTGERGLLHGAHPGLVVVDIGMLSLQAKEHARRLLNRAEVEMLDCPISGTSAMVLPRKTVLFGSGDQRVFETCRPVFEGFAGNVFYLGAFGAGTTMKCIANLLVAIHYVAAAEAMVMSTKAGLDTQTVLKVISPSIAGSAAFTSRAIMMGERRYEPPLGSIKELHECIEIIDAFAGSLGCPTPLLDAATHIYKEAIADGRGNQDVAALFAVLARGAGIET